MNLKILAYRLGAIGTLLAHGGGMATMVTVVPDTFPPQWNSFIRYGTAAVWVLGVVCGVSSKLLLAWIKAGEDALLPDASATKSATVPPTALILLPLLLGVLFFAGCTKATPTYSKATLANAKYYDAAYTNLSAQFDEQQRALLATYTQKKDVELTVDLRTLSLQAPLNPAKWTPTAIAEETTRLQALHDSKIEAYKLSLQNFANLKAKNEATNLANAHKLRDVLNPPPLPANTPTDLTPTISAAAGSPAPGPLVETPANSGK